MDSTVLRRRPLSVTQDGARPGGPLMFVVGPLVPTVMGAVVAAGLLLRWWQPGVLPTLGIAVLIAAVVVGLPHGALDVSLLSVDRRSMAVRGLCYALVAAAVYALWWRWPAAGIGILLVVAAAHFAVGDVAVAGWRRPLDPPGGLGGPSSRGCATGVLAVAGPFAVWPTQTGVVLDALHAGDGSWVITAASRLLSVLAVVVGVLTSIVAARRGDRTGAIEFWLLAALVLTCPPLLAFGTYFAAWHSLRQTARLLVLHPQAARRLQQNGIAAAVRLLVRQALLPTLVAAGGLVVIGLHHDGATATVLVGLLAISVPHALVTGIAEQQVAKTRQRA